MSTKPLVPSRDALRALRTLAYSTPTALIGTVGAVCGLATINYHERRKVCQAEMILETKRKLHTITKGRGSARLAIMFEAAERGEDFTIRNKYKRRRTSRRRHYSALAERTETGEDADHTPRGQPFTRQQDDVSIPVSTDASSALVQLELACEMHSQRSLKSKGRKSLSERVEKHIASGSDEPFVRQNDSVTEERSFPSRLLRGNTKSLNEIKQYGRSAPVRSHNLDNYAILMDQVRGRSKADRRATAASVTDAEDKDSSVGWSPMAEELAATQKVLALEDQPVADLQTLKAQPISDLNALTTTTNTKFDRSASDRPSGGPENILLDTNYLIAAMNRAFGSLQPWDDGVKSSKDKVVKSESKSQPDADLDLYVVATSPVPSVEIQHSYTSRYNLANDRVQQALSFAGVARYNYVFNSLMNYRATYGDQMALALIERTMHRYTITDKRPDWALVQALFLDCGLLFPFPEWKLCIWGFVRKFLAGDMPRLEVVSMLYPNCGAGIPSEKQFYYFLVHQYLQFVEEGGYSPDQQVTELRKILAGTRMLNLKLHEHLMVPVLKSYCAAGRMSSAAALYAEMVSHYKIEASFYSLQILIKGYAQAGKWQKVKEMLNDCYLNPAFRQKVYGMSNLLVSVIDAYSTTHSLDKVIDFVQHCIHQFGVQPVSGVTRKIVCLSLQYRRYDLVENWLEMIRTEFTYIETGTASSVFAYDVASVWKNIDASCEDILHGCRAIAGKSFRDPFSRTLRSTIAEAVTRYVTSRLHEVEDELGQDTPDFLKIQVQDFANVITPLKKYVAFPRGGQRGRLLLQDLVHQAEALLELNILCNGHPELVSNQDRQTLYRTRPTVRSESPAASPRLPRLSKLKTAIEEDYSARENQLLPLNHHKLKDNVSKLIQENRLTDAYDLVEHVYNSRWASPQKGLEFDLDLFTEWLSLTWKLKAGGRLRYVLWAILDASPSLKLSAQIVLLARIAAPKSALGRHKSAPDNIVEELEYLRTRMKRRRWASISGDGLRLSEWKGFTMQNK